MKKKSAIVLLYVVATIYALYIGRYETIYGVGVLTVLLLQAVCAVVFGIALLFTRFNVRRSFFLSIFLATLAQTTLIIAHEITSYVPTRTITIPCDFDGTVYLPVVPGERVDVTVNNFGIGYVGSKGRVEWRVEQCGRDITGEIPVTGYNEVSIRNEGNTQLIVYDVGCYHFDREPQELRVTCLDSLQFLQLVNEGMIDEQRLRKRVWKGNGVEESWVLNNSLSNL